MKTINRNYSNLDSSIKVIGIENINPDSLNKILIRLKSEDYQEYIGTFPENQSKSEVNSFDIDGITFMKTNSFSANNFQSHGIEEVIAILSKNGIIISKNSGGIWSRIKVAINNDPFHNIKNIGLDKSSIAIFYSPDDKDIEIFVHKDLYHLVITKLNSIEGV